MSPAETAERLVSYLESRGGNITESYHDWLIAGFCLATLDSQGGRQLYHRLSSLSGKYKAEDCDKQYDSCLRGCHDTSPNIAGLLALSAQHGYILKDSFPKRSFQRLPFQPTPPLPPPPANQQPTKWATNGSVMLQQVEGLIGDPRIRGAALISFCVGLSSITPNLKIAYQGDLQFCPLYFCLVAPPASGKSEIGKVGHLFDEVQQEKMDRTQCEWREYKEKRKELKPQDRDELPQPPLHTLFLPADTSTAALMKTLADNEGNGLMWESELDTLTRNMKSEYGNFNDILRNNWQGETITSNRKKDREYIRITNPHMSLLCCGTPQQVPHFFGSAENGLFSRFLFGSLPLCIEWRDQFDIEPSKGRVQELARQLLDYHRYRRDGNGSSVVTFTTSQKRQHRKVWEQTNLEVYELGGDELIASVRRHALAQLRIAALLTSLEQWEKREFISGAYAPQPPTVECSPTAWRLAEQLAQASISATTQAYSLLLTPRKSNGTRKEEERQQLFLSLPSPFSIGALPSTMSQSTKYRLLDLWTQEGMIEKREGGYYKRV